MCSSENSLKYALHSAECNTVARPIVPVADPGIQDFMRRGRLNGEAARPEAEGPSLISTCF